MVLDIKLTFKPQVELVMGIVTIITWYLRRVVGKSGNLHLMYTAAIRPKITTYREVIWCLAVEKLSIGMKLAGLQRPTCVGITRE